MKDEVPEKYAAWLKHVFDRPVPESGYWYYDAEDKEFEAPADEMVEVLSRTFRQAGTDLASYSDEQLNAGFWYIFTGFYSNAIFNLLDEALPEGPRYTAIRNMKYLYRDCFAKRCTPVLSHLNQPGSALNSACYMLWDISPLGSYKAVVTEVMADALTIPNIACIESALHGLGHCLSQHIEVVEEILSNFKTLNLDLSAYAERAKRGNVL